MHRNVDEDGRVRLAELLQIDLRLLVLRNLGRRCPYTKWRAGGSSGQVNAREHARGVKTGAQIPLLTVSRHGDDAELFQHMHRNIDEDAAVRLVHACGEGGNPPYHTTYNTI